jgi:hypothetical protein
VKSRRTAVDSDGVTLDPAHDRLQPGFRRRDNLEHPGAAPVIDGTFIDARLHNALVYDSTRNLYFASVPGRWSATAIASPP